MSEIDWKHLRFPSSKITQCVQFPEFDSLSGKLPAFDGVGRVQCTCEDCTMEREEANQLSAQPRALKRTENQTRNLKDAIRAFQWLDIKGSGCPCTHNEAFNDLTYQGGWEVLKFLRVIQRQLKYPS